MHSTTGSGGGSGAVKVASLPGKGLGVVAARPIRRGEPLFTERPIAEVVQHGPSRSERTTELCGDKQAALAQLLSLSQACPGATPVERAINTNGFVLRDTTGRAPPLRRTLCFPTISRVNHSCVPNAEFTWYVRDGAACVRATRDVAPGEEVTIDYGAPDGPRALRREHLRRTFRFECTCERCAAERQGEHEETAQLKESRWAEIERWLPAAGMGAAAPGRGAPM